MRGLAGSDGVWVGLEWWWATRRTWCWWGAAARQWDYKTDIPLPVSEHVSTGDEPYSRPAAHTVCAHALTRRPPKYCCG